MELNHRNLYRLPWNYADNIITWLEPTKTCNIYCEGCYSANRPNAHKTLKQIEQDLDVFGKYRNTHAVSIAGGEPLCHPQITEVVKMTAERGYKPIVNTNGYSMTEDLMRKLKDAGMVGLTFHIDSLQTRNGWKNKNEIELNELRLHYAKMAAKVGGLSCAFNSTVYGDTLKYVPELLKWAQDNIDIVHVMVFIAFRGGTPPEFNCFVKGKKMDVKEFVYGDDKGQRTNITSREMVKEIKKAHSNFSPCAYLNGTEDPSALKWLLTLRLGNKNKILGYMGPKFIELAQMAYHFLFSKYLGYMHPKVHRRVKRMFPLAIFDKGLWKTFKKWFFYVVKNPVRLFKSLHMQSIMMIQPVDFCSDGRQSMCDGCPDMTVHDGKLVWSCRLEEQLKYNSFFTSFPKEGKVPCGNKTN
ncbi:MAG TPA: radical SAM protein [Elusimicrobiales bacterium]|nr:radical SAM protein [Elusimicrobiales bacterium]